MCGGLKSNFLTIEFFNISRNIQTKQNAKRMSRYRGGPVGTLYIRNLSERVRFVFKH